MYYYKNRLSEHLIHFVLPKLIWKGHSYLGLQCVDLRSVHLLCLSFCSYSCPIITVISLYVEYLSHTFRWTVVGATVVLLDAHCCYYY